ncbi:Peptidase family M1 [Cnuella takakiae]|uniref:Peptidase family M1 n=1 Tax=Cnuella takakiae TaxID=1302690 RepID=A0A1M4S8C5_9BACT|nr:M1 family metallopeptidase [Cnuella takakiae]OLY94416.1 peptidase M1 [Cnuella takakiae]SHE28466.1 Peptidase family M1 [Cnuella takakiae]
MKRNTIITCLLLLTASSGIAQQKAYTRADTLRGSITPQRAWWDVLHYDLSVQPDYTQKTIKGSNRIRYKTTAAPATAMQLDLQESLHIDSIVWNKKQSLTFSKDGNAWLVNTPQQKGEHELMVYYSGKPREAVRAPWDGGWTFTTDSLGRPWMTVTCQGLGASVWYPCKDHQSDEPDRGAALTMIVPDTLVAVGNGRLKAQQKLANGLASYRWEVTNPINNYNIIPYIGKYVSFGETYAGEKGKLDVAYWVLDYNLDKAKAYLPTEVHNMFNAFEYWFGPYAFYEDSYKLVDVPHTGMEHQSAVAYGNHYKPGYRGRDGSGTGWGMKWDFIVIHESGHEWFGNNITTRDLADMWVHEGFTNYSETLFVDRIFGVEAGNEYNAGTRRGIRNDAPIIPAYNVNAQGSGDMYPKGGNLLHSIRHSLNNDALFRSILRELNKDFYHQTVTSAQVEQYISKKAGFDYDKVFDQYLRTTQIPKFEYYLSDAGKKVHYRYTNCVAGFNLPLVLQSKEATIRILPGTAWKSTDLKSAEAALFTKAAIEQMYYLDVVPAEGKTALK